MNNSDLPTSVRFKNYKSFNNADYYSVDTTNHITLLIGKNNSGKSSCIDVLSSVYGNTNYLSDLAVSFIVSEPHINRSFNKGMWGGEISGDHYEYGKRLEGKNVFLSINTVNGRKEFNASSLTTEFSLYNGKNNIKRLASSYNPFFDRVSFIRINAERNIIPEEEAQVLGLSDEGMGASNIIRQFLNHSDFDETIITKTILKELNTIMKADAEFSDIKVQQVKIDDKLLWEVFLEEKNAGRFALSKSGSGLKTVLLILINLYLIPYINPNNNHYDQEYKNKKKVVYAFEELENNLHPALQRRVFEYLYKFAMENDTQFYITSHSHVAINCFFNKKSTKIYHVHKNDNCSYVEEVENYIDKTRLLDDLDVKASDILQTNGIIWVEGPSDRIYIKHWLNLFTDFRYQEGIDYQFLYYGGKLLSHYSIDECKDLINILLTNRNSAIVMDSDKRNRNSPINDTKKRIRDEFDSHHLFCWITKGKEIENYISAEAVNKKYDVNKQQIKPYELFSDYIQDVDSSFSNHKVSFAKEVIEYLTLDNSKNIYDLKSMVIKLYEEIKRWNN